MTPQAARLDTAIATACHRRISPAVPLSAFPADARLGVGIVTYNRCARLSETLDRVLQHTTYETTTIVIADDGSTDGTQDMLRARGVTVLSGANMGVAWNKNRALFLLAELCDCDVVILLEDDTYPVCDGWERDWIAAAERWGHANVARDCLRDGFIAGSGTLDDPIRGTLITAQCSVFSRNALRFGGYFDPRFRGYGHEHVEHSRRLARLGYGGADEEADGHRRTVFWMLRGGVDVADAPSTGNAESIARNLTLAHLLMSDESYRQPWSNEAEMHQFRAEMQSATISHRRPERIALPARDGWSAEPSVAEMNDVMREFVDPEWYLAQNQDVAEAGLDPVAHFLAYGLREGRNPNAWFDARWYAMANPDVVASRTNMLTHYAHYGAAEGRNPHPDFDASWYMAEHPEVGCKPLQAHLRHGRAAGWATHRRSAVAAYIDAAWYVDYYRDVAAAGIDPVEHFIRFGEGEQRKPNPFFDSAWYERCHPDVRANGLGALTHYVLYGEAELRCPHPDFDATWYADQHKDCAGRPLLHFLRIGRPLGWATRKAVAIEDYLPSTLPPMTCPPDVCVDVVIPVHRGFEQTRQCILSVLDDPDRPPGTVIVIDDVSPEPVLSAWLVALAATGAITLLRNQTNLGFVRSVNRGIETAADRDVVLLNSDTEVPSGWLRRLAAHAYADARIASVSPFSNNATICSYPNDRGGAIPQGLSLVGIDDICRTANAGRQIRVPTTVGFCMYIRRNALNEVGVFDAQSFGKGYGEENDFCLRAAARGWHHVLACDVFVSHEGSVSFGAERAPRAAEAFRVLSALYPDYPRAVARHVEANSVGPYRFTVTAELFRRSGRPTILMLTHDLGGGVEQHLETLIAAMDQQANILVLRPSSGGVSLSAPHVHDAPVLTLSSDRVDDVIAVLRSAAVSRVHIHHLAGMELDTKRLVLALGASADVTVHDYFAICPQINLLPWPQAATCNEPDSATCNACIAERPSFCATDILAWRHQHAWPFFLAERVICPSKDVQDRLDRFGLAGRAIVRPHDPIAAGPWRVAPPPLGTGRLRIAILGTLANHKGAHVVAAFASAMDPARIDLQLIGHTEADFPHQPNALLPEHGRYATADLPDLIAAFAPHVVWFPASSPETYSYTLNAAIDADLPIVASGIGAFPERLAGRPLTWLVAPDASVATWLQAFEEVRAALRMNPSARQGGWRPEVPDFYRTDYLVPRTPEPRHRGAAGCTPSAAASADLRRPGRISIVVIPERLAEGALSPCAYIRLLQPLNHPDIVTDCDVVIADAELAVYYRADIFVTQRHAVPDIAAADALAAHVADCGATLIYDLDDDLLHVPLHHADAVVLRPKAGVVRRMLSHAHEIWVSTAFLAATLPAVEGRVTVIGNGLDERLWGDAPSPPRSRFGPIRMLYMGTATHAEDLALIEPALERINRDFSGRLEIELIGVTSRTDTPGWLLRRMPAQHAKVSYPAFIDWIGRQTPWDIGLAPLCDSQFNQAKSAIKVLDYAALGLAVIASDLPVYRAALAGGRAGMLVQNSESAWYTGLSALIRDGGLRRTLAAAGRDALAERGTLRAQSAERRAALRAAVDATPRWAAPHHRKLAR